MLGLRGWFQFKSLLHVFCPFIISAHNTCEGNALTLLKIHSIKQNFHRLGFSHLSFSSLFCLEDISYWEPTSLLLLLFLLALLFQLILFNNYISIVFLHPIFYAIYLVQMSTNCFPPTVMFEIFLWRSSIWEKDKKVLLSMNYFWDVKAFLTSFRDSGVRTFSLWKITISGREFFLKCCSTQPWNGLFKHFKHA